jgi:hypothetical protein
MLPYWLLFLAFALGAIQTRGTALAVAPYPGVPAWRIPGQQPLARRSDLFFAAAAAVAALMIGLRYEVGGDWDQYLRIFDDINKEDLLSSLSFPGSDPGYSVLNWLSGAIGVQVWAVNLACGIVFIFGLVRFTKCQPNAWLAFLVAVPYLVIVVGMGYTRQAVAIGLSMAGFAALSKGSFRSFILWMFAAGLFHRTAVILVPIVALSYTRNRVQTLLVGAVASIIGYYFLLVPAMDRFSAGYVVNVYESQGAGIRLAMNVPPAAIFLIFSRRFGLSEPERVTWRNLAIIALGAFALYFRLETTTVIDRLALYIIPLQVLVFSRLPSAFAGAGRRSGLALAGVLLYSAGVQFVWLNFANHASYWVPYRIYPLLWEPGESSRPKAY